ncbi:MAG: PEGA domain-containing protein [Fibromonadaceae bacterium]|jgi:hypothetical protein|nr:PEGA domain-containing protein [Fibromonadaceae bacterium]
MKIKFKFSAVFFLLLAMSAWASSWTIASFDDSSDPGEPDKYVAEESRGSGLVSVDPSRVTPQSGRLYVRQKFEDFFGEDATYQIFQGRATEAASTLGKISLEGIPYATLLRMKLFYARNATGNDDLETVYFDGKDIFVEGEDPVFINLNGRMEELKPVVSRSFVVSITSDPPGATVTVGGNSRGETPVEFSVPSNRTIAVVVTKEGYYTAIRPVTPNERQTVQEGFLLVERAPLTNPVVAFRTRLQTAVDAKDASTVRGIRDEAQTALRNYNAESRKSIDAVMSKFPANLPKTASEAANDFTARQNLWTNAQAREREALNKDAQAYFEELRAFVTDAEAAVASLDFALRYEYIPSSAISFSAFSVNGFTIDAQVENSRVNFKTDKARLSYGTVPRREIESDRENVHGVLKIWDTPNENNKHAAFYEAAFFYGETLLPVQHKGTISSKDATTASRNTERDLNARIARFTGKSAWDAKDREATLEVLRSGEVSRPAAVATTTMPADDYGDAYYDEDEDDDEYDDGMYAQERQDYSRYGAMSSSDVFGSSDEYLFWTGIVFAAAALGTGVVGFLENQKWQEANDAYRTIEREIKNTENRIIDACGGRNTPCFNAYLNAANSQNHPGLEDGETVDALRKLRDYERTTKKTRDSYNTSRIIWFSAAGLSTAISITLFAW